MLNNFPLNAKELNNEEDFVNISDENIYSSFSLNLETKYGFKSKSGLFFNFNNICGKKFYGNRVEEHDFDDIPAIDIFKYGNALKNGGVIYDRRYTEKIFNITLTIFSDNLENLENEIRELKSLLEIGGEFYKVEKQNTLKMSIQLQNFEVGRLLVTGTEIKIQAISMDPFWQTLNYVTLANEGNSGSFSGSLNLVSTKIRGFVKHIIYLKTITGNINSLTLTLGGFPITINGNMFSGNSVVLDGIGGNCFINNTKVKFLGQFPELEINTPYALTITFSGGGSVSDFDLYNIYKNEQL